MPIETFSYPTVQLIDKMGGDHSIVRAARVSVSTGEIVVNTEDEKEIKRNNGLINYLMREKHGSPFEQNSMTFYVKAPIFVFREFHRHRAGFSYNEMSGRYTKLNPEFWIPAQNRPLQNVGTSAKPEMAPLSLEAWEEGVQLLTEGYENDWRIYERLLELGWANEAARAKLPVALYSQMYVTLNLRSAFNFLSLRTHEPEAAHVSRPQREIEDVAREIEKHLAQLFPVAYKTFNDHGRVAP
ncbi:ThyX-like thymidylate synthase [Microbacterium phage Pumpernickel]|uniref:ThyX-like thymidylate synthase n=1 Tax=Microbacterium phage Pumpernickel TaxID=2885983 RepID=A0AAE8Y9Z1_9CAUD|nr:ThyX-like thymidylate synthase [Microbacterium phage Pumpernickel]UDL15912.1 ThyX-like thymidylate synthase [Microbacterium phage Pumpernickel]